MSPLLSLSLSLSLSLLLQGISATPHPSSSSHYAVKEIFLPPHGWTPVAPPPPDHVLHLHLHLAHSDLPQLHRHLYQISDPDHPRYGLHLSKQQVDALVAPTNISLDLVDQWLSLHAIDLASVSRSGSRDTVSFPVSVAKAEQMLQTKYVVYRHTSTGEHLVRTTRYSIPSHLHDHIDLVQPTTVFSRVRPQRSFFRWENGQAKAFTSHSSSTILANGQQVDAACNTSITVNCIRQLYNAVNVTASGITTNHIGVTGYLNQSASHSDYSLFLTNQTDQPSTLGFEVVLINGGKNNETGPGGEANLDTQFAFGIAAPSPATFWSTGGSPPFNPSVGTPSNTNEPYTEWINFVLSQPTIPQTISTSYGDDEQTVPRSFALRVCAGFAQMSARGTTLLFSSGDGGVGDGDPNPATQECFTNDGTNSTRFIPAFPASCPFVTAVGATIHVPEVAEGFSGGGFSNYFLRPIFQEQAVSQFLKTLPKGTYAGLFNPLGRGIPDVALQGVNFRIFFRGRNAGISGTSASAPGFAGLISLINDQRLLHGQPTLGFLNPMIYKHANDFNDITIGNNPGCGTPGFNATQGWDAVTGLGTPNVGKLLQSLVFGK